MSIKFTETDFSGSEINSYFKIKIHFKKKVNCVYKLIKSVKKLKM